MVTTTTSPQAAFTPVIEPHTQQWLDQLAAASAGNPPLWELSPEDARQLLRYVQASVPVRLQPADIDDRVIPGGPTGQVSIRIVRPGRAAGVLPVIFHFHGGGWILGDKDTNERLDRELASAVQAVVVFVDYTPAPEVTTLGGLPAASATVCAARACWCVRRNPATPLAASPKAKCRSLSTPAAASAASNLSRIPSGSQAQAQDSSRGRNTGSPEPAIFPATRLIVCSSRVALSAAAVASAAQHTRPTWYWRSR
jgi:hypothetical protein